MRTIRAPIPLYDQVGLVNFHYPSIDGIERVAHGRAKENTSSIESVRLLISFDIRPVSIFMNFLLLKFI
ncbi:hypothetical protein ACFSTB_14300 [Sphingobacterium chuzhouense]|uniref:Uncharacterized protein n=1 Tax=Sphingobacterium chuzhouense TaxID=1742264 RepID=A0ABR7XSY9_9SPHI|nr:hypothetical protein [Sphingobacterium chuzhouense]